MNRHEAYSAEREHIQQALGYPVTVEEAANMMKTASKVVSVISSYSYSVSFREARLILALAEKSLDEIVGGIE